MTPLPPCDHDGCPKTECRAPVVRVELAGVTTDELWSNLNWLLCNALELKQEHGDWPLMVSETGRGKIEMCPVAAPARESGVWYEIPHPGTLEKVRCATFEEAMNKWFEGFNIPVRVADGVREDFSSACDRVRRYCDMPNHQTR